MIDRWMGTTSLLGGIMGDVGLVLYIELMVRNG